MKISSRYKKHSEGSKTKERVIRGPRRWPSLGKSGCARKTKSYESSWAQIASLKTQRCCLTKSNCPRRQRTDNHRTVQGCQRLRRNGRTIVVRQLIVKRLIQRCALYHKINFQSPNHRPSWATIRSVKDTHKLKKSRKECATSRSSKTRWMAVQLKKRSHGWGKQRLKALISALTCLQLIELTTLKRNLHVLRSKLKITHGSPTTTWFSLTQTLQTTYVKTCSHQLKCNLIRHIRCQRFC